MDKQLVGELPDITQSSNDDEIMVITDAEHNQLRKEKIENLITDFTSSNENNALKKGSDNKLFVTDFSNADNITSGTLNPERLPEITTDMLPDSGVTAATYPYPVNLQVNQKGQIVSVEAGEPGANNANTDLSNLSPKGEKHFLNKTQITNCILEAPKNIKLELDSESGKITLKAGSIIGYPSGKDIFEYLTIDTDVSVTDSYSYTGDTMLFANLVDGGVAHIYNEIIASCKSGDTAPIVGTNYSTWYDTAENKIKRTNDKGTSWKEGYSFPLAILSYNNKVTSIKQIFDYAGFIGPSFFIHKGIKALLSNGKNNDNSLANIEKIYDYTLSFLDPNLYDTDLKLFLTNTKSFYLIETKRYLTGLDNDKPNPASLSNGTWLYKTTDTNRFYLKQQEIWEQVSGLLFAELSKNNNGFTKINAEQPVELVKKSDIFSNHFEQYIQDSSRKMLLLTNNYIDIAFNKTLTAEADGYATVDCENMHAAAQIAAYVFTPDGNTGIGNQHTAAQGTNCQGAMFIPKGNKYRVWANGGNLKYARFYYCETGEK